MYDELDKDLWLNTAKCRISALPFKGEASLGARVRLRQTHLLQVLPQLQLVLCDVAGETDQQSGNGES